MLRIYADAVRAVRAAQAPEDLYEWLRGAVRLEHSTIPPYLQALYSLKPGANLTIAAILRSIVVQEMLHMAIAANLLNALGGEPLINTPDFVPAYPGPLPLNVHEGLQVGLAPFSMALVEQVFKVIEEPEDPQDFPAHFAALEATGFATIGLFYAALSDKLTELGDSAFKGDPKLQVADANWFPTDQLFPIHDVASAKRGISVVVDQGEGTSKDPFDSPGEPAHYYRFVEILKHRKLVKDANGKPAYAGDEISFDASGVWNLRVNPTVDDYPLNSTARTYADRFNVQYGNLLNGLHRTFNGEPGYLQTVIGNMFELRLAAEAMMTLPPGADGLVAAPTYQPALGPA